jgi:hypothetical protein
MATTTLARGGEWLLQDAENVFTPDKLTDEHRLIARCCPCSSGSRRRTGRWRATW